MTKVGYGARGKVLIKYNGTIRELGDKIKSDLHVSDWDYDTDMFPPHDEFAIGEALGINIGIHKLNKNDNFNYVFSFLTSTTSNLDTFGKNHSLSDWMASYLQTLGYQVFSVSWEYDLWFIVMYQS